MQVRFVGLAVGISDVLLSGMLLMAPPNSSRHYDIYRQLTVYHHQSKGNSTTRYSKNTLLTDQQKERLTNQKQ